jgi:hypothetical protein
MANIRADVISPLLWAGSVGPRESAHVATRPVHKRATDGGHSRVPAVIHALIVADDQHSNYLAIPFSGTTDLPSWS